MRLIADGVVDRDGVGGLARRLGYSERHLNRLLVETVGASPLALARSTRVQNARVLLERTDLSMAEVALTAGFSSVRQFNTSIREVHAMTPRELRARGGGRASERADGVRVRLPAREPFDGEALIAFLTARAVPGVEQLLDGAYRRSLRLPHAAGVVELAPASDHVSATLWLDDMRDFGPAVNRCRRLLDVDSDPAAIVERLGDDAIVGALVRSAPGRRVAGSVDGCETAVRALLGQQVSVDAARGLAARLVAACGEPLRRPVGEVTQLFPSAAAVGALDPGSLPMPRARAQALVRLAGALERGEVVLDGGAGRDEVISALTALPGIGNWTAEYIAMRELRDPDAFLARDAGVRRSLTALGFDGSPESADQLSQGWRPYRAYALQHLWAHNARREATAVPADVRRTRARNQRLLVGA